MNTLTPLQQLHDIHLPAPISFWPLAPGWYGIMLFILLAGAAIGWKAYRRWQQADWQRAALLQLSQLQKQFEENILKKPVMAELSTLLKRVVLARFPREHVAGLKGELWLNFLDQQGNTQAFTQGIGRLLITAPYQPHTPTEVLQVFSLIAQWLSSKKRQGGIQNV